MGSIFKQEDSALITVKDRRKNTPLPTLPAQGICDVKHANTRRKSTDRSGCFASCTTLLPGQKGKREKLRGSLNGLLTWKEAAKTENTSPFMKRTS